MDGMDESTRDALETVEFLVASPVRQRILAALMTDRPVAVSRLRNRLDVPRSTLHRNLSTLVDRGFVDRSASASEFELTAAGEIARETVDDAISKIDAACSLVPFLDYFPVGLPVPTEALLEADVVESAADAPFDPVSTVKSLVVDGNDIRGFLPVVNPMYVEALNHSVERSVSVDVIAPPAAYDRLADDHPDTFDTLLDASSVRLYESPAVPEYAVGFVDETIVLGAFDEHMRTHSVLQAESQTAIWEWAVDRYAAVEAEARRVDPD